MAERMSDRVTLKKKLLLVLPLLFCIPAIVGYVNKDLVVFPGIHGDRLAAYSDSSINGKNKGKSYVKELGIDSVSIHAVFHRVSAIEYPYAGFQINKPVGTQFVNITPYKHLVLSATSYNSKGLQITLRTFAPAITKYGREDTYRPNMRDLYLLPGTNTYSLSLESFNTESWWFSENKLTESQVGDIDYSRLIDMQIESEDISPGDIDEQIRIYAIRFEKDNTLLYGITIALVFLYYAGFCFYATMIKRIKTPLAIPYEKLNMVNYNDEYLRKIVDCIAKDYTDKGLTITKISEKTGISSSKIAQVIQLSFNLSFKQYLNTIRLSEAQRLFRETDRQISEISYSVGYQNITHFYRVFKQVYKISPSEFRKKALDSSI